MIRIHAACGGRCNLFTVPRVSATGQHNRLKSNIDAQITHNNTGQLLDQIHAAIRFRTCPRLKSHFFSSVKNVATLHNLHFYQDLMRAIRKAIEDNRYAAWSATFLERHLPKSSGNSSA